MADSTGDLLDVSLASWPEWRLSSDTTPALGQAPILEATLSQRPRVVQTLEGGLTSQNYLLEAGGHLLVLRVNCVDETLLGLDRYRERDILGMLAGQIFVPELVYCQPESGVLVTKYIQGRHWQREEINDPVKWRRLLGVLEKSHQYRNNLPNFDYQIHIEDYWYRLKKTGLDDNTGFELYRQAGEALEYLSALNKSSPGVLCHHDPGPLNFIESNQGHLVLLDWEYSGLGWPVMDHSALLRQWQPSSELLEQSNLARYSTDELSAAHRVWDFIDHAWYRLREL